MKKAGVLLLVLMQFFFAEAQSSVFKSLELYNFYYNNPAYIISDSKKLYGFCFKASFMADVADLDSGDDPSTQYQINCNCDDCSWY